MELSWFKRRTPKEEDKIVAFEVVGFKKISNHFCHLEVEYKSGLKKTYFSRVIKKVPEKFFTDQRVTWIVDGMHAAVYFKED